MSFSHCFYEQSSSCQLCEALGNEWKLKFTVEFKWKVFFSSHLFIISSLESRHLLYLQLRKSILESHILCNDEELISLGGLALQSEIGDFTESVSVKFATLEWTCEFFFNMHKVPTHQRLVKVYRLDFYE